MIHFFSGRESDFYPVEFGHSVIRSEKTVGPWVREKYLLHAVVRGTCRFSEFEVPAGECLFIAKGMRHSFRVADGYEHYWIGFDGARVPALLQMLGISPGAHAHFRLQSPAYAEQLLRSAFEACASENGEAITASALLSLLGLLQIRPKAPGADGYAERAARFIERNYHRPITMEEVAAQVQISEKYLCRLFQSAYRCAPKQYLSTVRMQNADRLLCETDLRIQEIAATVGYSSQVTFSKVFSGCFGCSPTERRQAARQNRNLQNRSERKE